jgi:hypothetical protein
LMGRRWPSFDRTWFPGAYKQEIFILILILRVMIKGDRGGRCLCTYRLVRKVLLHYNYVFIYHFSLFACFFIARSLLRFDFVSNGDRPLPSILSNSTLPFLLRKKDDKMKIFKIFLEYSFSQFIRQLDRRTKKSPFF